MLTTNSFARGKVSHSFPLTQIIIGLKCDYEFIKKISPPLFLSPTGFIRPRPIRAVFLALNSSDEQLFSTPIIWQKKLFAQQQFRPFLYFIINIVEHECCTRIKTIQFPLSLSLSQCLIFFSPLLLPPSHISLLMAAAVSVATQSTVKARLPGPNSAVSAGAGKKRTASSGGASRP